MAKLNFVIHFVILSTNFADFMLTPCVQKMTKSCKKVTKRVSAITPERGLKNVTEV